MSKKKKIRWRALDINVVVVAKEGSTGDWSAYIGAVRGDSHEREWRRVMTDGSKLPQNVAEVIFPDFAKQFEWRH